MNTIKINLNECSGCKTCFKACFIDVIRWDKEKDQPIVAYPQDCVQCNYCEISCPMKCIEVVPDWGKYFPPSV